ncbi:DJ-1/PfpI family protein [Clostridium butyricum]|uniref:DJ-1/PfpI family protein n=1 Tax=Clostridium butyricum TaxID=1492 RepID=UPI0022E22139|nr:DJ-1/PfpI family protein [Clostridium butyricum]
MGKILLFIFDDMTDYEVTFITHLLKADAGKEIITISYEDKIIKSSSGLLYKPNKLVKDVFNYDVDGLIICGGWFGEVRCELIELINKLNSQNKLLAGICGAGTFFLAVSRVLNDVKYTTPISSWTEKHTDVFGAIDPFPRENYIQKRVVTDKNIITAQGIAFIDFAVEICDWFNLFESEKDKNEFTHLYKG